MKTRLTAYPPLIFEAICPSMCLALTRLRPLHFGTAAFSISYRYKYKLLSKLNYPRFNWVPKQVYILEYSDSQLGIPRRLEKQVESLKTHRISKHVNAPCAPFTFIIESGYSSNKEFRVNLLYRPSSWPQPPMPTLNFRFYICTKY